MQGDGRSDELNWSWVMRVMGGVGKVWAAPCSEPDGEVDPLEVPSDRFLIEDPPSKPSLDCGGSVRLEGRLDDFSTPGRGRPMMGVVEDGTALGDSLASEPVVCASVEEVADGPASSLPRDVWRDPPEPDACEWPVEGAAGE